MTLNAQNSYSGGTVVSGGTLYLAADGGNGIIKGLLTINSGGAVNADTNWSLGYSGSNYGGSNSNIVTGITINGGVLNFRGSIRGG